MSKVDSAMKVRNTPLPASWLKNATPGPLPPCPCGAATRNAIPMTTGNTTVTASSSWLRRRPKTSRSSDRNSRPQDAAGLRAAVGPRVTVSAVDIETLPGEPDEQVLQARRGDREAADADPGVYELGADAFRLGLSQQGRGLVRAGLGVGQAKGGEHLDRAVGVGGLHHDPGRAGPAQLGQRALEHQPAGAHHPDVRADLLDLGQQVGGDEHRVPSAAIWRTSARTSRVPCGSSPL